MTSLKQYRDTRGLRGPSPMNTFEYKRGRLDDNIVDLCSESVRQQLI